jgi:hypothetical protein
MAIDPGKYRGRITDYGVTQSQAGQQLPTVFILFELVGQYDPDTGDLLDCPLESRSYYKSISPKTIDWLLSDLKAIGYDRPGLEYLDPEVPGAADLFGREIDVVCDQENYDGRTRERWSIHRERTREKIGREGLARLDAQYGEQIRRVLGAGDAAVSPPPLTVVNDDNQF